jgi:hypothetical protein
MGRRRFVNQKLAKRTGFRERQAAHRAQGRQPGKIGAATARRGKEQRAIIGRPATQANS